MVLRWGMIGCGSVTEVKSGPALQKARGSRLVAVMCRTPGRADEHARRHGISKAYEDAEELIGDPEVDAIYVATPVGSHCQYALMACRAGKPVYVEKPIARNATEASMMVEHFDQAGIKLFVAFYRRALPRFLKVKELIDSGILGKLTSLHYLYTSVRRHEHSSDELGWRFRARDSGGGLLLDLGSHALDLFDYLLGPLVDPVGIAANVASGYDVEDNVAMHFRTGCGAIGTASWNFAAHTKIDRVELMGTEGMLSFSVFGDVPVQLRSRTTEEDWEIPHPRHIQQPLVQSIVDELSGRGECPSTGRSALRTAEVTDTLLETYYGGRSDAFWERAETWPGRRHSVKT